MNGSDSADDGIMVEVKKHERGTNLASGSRGERELTDENLAEHISGRNRKWRPPAGRRGGTARRRPRASPRRRNARR